MTTQPTPTHPTPAQLRIDNDRALVIVWSDDVQQRLAVKLLRDRCPCSVCRKEPKKPAGSSSSLTVLSEQELQPLAIASMTPVGNYAYSIDFSDGHRTGIYSFEFLRNLS